MNKKKIKTKIRKMMRLSINRSYRKRLINKNFTILCSNCIGGVIYHELNQEFKSPTINLYFSASDYIKFIQNLNYYLNLDLVQIYKKEVQYPLGQLDDIIIHFVHYSSFEEAKRKWYSRIKKINFDNIFLMMLERDFCSEKILKNLILLIMRIKWYL